MNNLIALGHAMRGFVPTAMSVDREREKNSRLDVLESRAAETHGMQKQTHAAQLATTGLQAEKLQHEVDDDAKLRGHLTSWRDSRQKIQAGDFAAFEAGLAEYNQNQGWAADGFTMKPRPTADGSATVLDRYDASGKLVESSPPLTRGEVLRLYDTGMAEKMKWLNPKRYDQAVKGVTEQQAKAAELAHKEKIAAGNNATTLEAAKLNQGAADHRHAGTLAVQRDRLEWDKTRPGGGLTLTQQRQNEEIAAARDMVTGLDPEEIRRRTTPTAASGRENRDYDPDLARAAKLANRRLIGDDPTFARGRGPQPSNTFAGKPLDQMTDTQLEQFGRQAGAKGRLKIDAELARRTLVGMPEMQGHQIGEYVEGKGYQVLDAQGSPVSYLRKKAR